MSKDKEKPVRLSDLPSNHSRLKVTVAKQLVKEGSYRGAEQKDEAVGLLLEDIKKS